MNHTNHAIDVIIKIIKRIVCNILSPPSVYIPNKIRILIHFYLHDELMAVDIVDDILLLQVTVPLVIYPLLSTYI